MYSHPFHDPNEDHPFIVLSSSIANDKENTFVGVMITTSDHYKDEFSFPVSSAMFEKPLRKEPCHVRMHLITTGLDECKGATVNRMKKQYFDQLMRSIDCQY